MSLKEDLTKLISSVTDEGDDEYQKFKRGELKLVLVGDCSREYDEADMWEWWCDQGRLYCESAYENPKEYPFVLVPSVFYNPIFKKEKMIPFKERLKTWLEYQKKEKKYKTCCFRTPKYLYEFKDDHVILYTRGCEIPEIFEILPQHLMFLPDRSATISKDEFFKLESPHRSRRPPKKRRPRKSLV